MLAILLSLAVQKSPVVCPVMGVEAIASAGRYDFAGARIGFCCLACRNAFESDPAEAAKSAREKNLVYATFLFDPVSRRRFDPKRPSAEPADGKGVRYPFSSEAARERFLAGPKAFVEAPPMEATYCYGERAKKDGYGTAWGYGDYEKVRYYLYCPGCLAAFEKDPAAFAAMAKDSVAAVAPHEVKPDP